METTINELLLEAYKKSYEAQSSLLKAKDVMINFLEAHIDELKLKLSQCIKESMSYTGLTDEEFKEIEKLTEEIMDEQLEVNECLEEMTIEFKIDDFNKTLREAMTRTFGILFDSKENTTTENSDVIHSIELVNCGLTKDLIDALNQRLSNRDTV